MSRASSVRFPNETDAYRDARDALLDAETELRRKTEAVAALRRQLPLGGRVPEDYAFDEIIVDWPLWNVFDLTPDGRGTLWYPKLSYGGEPLHDVAMAARP